MKTHNKITLGAILTVSVFVVTAGVVLAQSPPASPKPGSSFEQRLVQRKRERNIRLEDKDERRLNTRCVKAQAAVRTLQQRTTPILANREKIYHQIDGKLWVVIGRLKLAERDTFSLEKQRAALAGKVAAFKTIADNYEQTLDDIGVINCQADTVGFKALVDTARIYHDQLRARSADIKEYIVNDIKQTLSGHVNDMRPQGDAEAQ